MLLKADIKSGKIVTGQKSGDRKRDIKAASKQAEFEAKTVAD